jgi:hypothetical protein
MKSKAMRLTWIATIGVVAFGGGADSRRAAPSSQAVSDHGGGAPRQQAALAFQADQAKVANAAAPSAPEATERLNEPSTPSGLFTGLKLIRNATLSVEVDDFKKAVASASATVAALGGYVSGRQSQDNGSGRESGSITIRIPSTRFDGAIGSLRDLGRITNETVTTDDVTKAYADLETRLAAKRETAKRLREILVRQTGKVSEVLEVEREIGRVIEEIEQAEGERRYYDNLVSLSTITLNLYERDSVVTPGMFDSVTAALRRSLRLMSESVAVMIEAAAFLLPWAALFYVAYRLIRRSFRKKTS